MKVLIIGGVAGGATAAARLRRLDEKAEIVIIERSGFISYANCGLPYYIGGAITDRGNLTLQTPESFQEYILDQLFRIFGTTDYLYNQHIKRTAVTIEKCRKTFCISIQYPCYILCFVVLYHDIRLDADKSERLQPQKFFFFCNLSAACCVKQCKERNYSLKNIRS